MIIKRGPLGILLLALAAGAGILYGFLPRPVEVDMARAEKGELVITVEEEGKTRVRERFAISAPVAGYVRRLGLKVGDAVAVGQTLAVIEPSRADALDPRSRAQAEARVRAAGAAVEASRESARAAAAEERLAEQEFERAQALGQAKFVAQTAVDQARARLQAGRATRQAADQNIRVAEHELAVARAALIQGKAAADGRVAVTSPVAGRVLAVMHESEGAVPAGQPLLEIGNPDSLEVVVELLSTAAVKLAPGGPVRLDRWGGDAPLDAVVRVIEPAGFTKTSALGVEEQRVRVLCDIVTPRERWRQLGDGYRVEAGFTVWRGRDVLLAPTSALFRHGDGWAVFVVENGKARLRPVRVDHRNGLSAEITEGLQAGEALVARPDERIAEGTPVRARNDA